MVSARRFFRFWKLWIELSKAKLTPEKEVQLFENTLALLAGKARVVMRVRSLPESEEDEPPHLWGRSEDEDGLVRS